MIGLGEVSVKGEVKLVYVIEGGRLEHVSKYAGLSPRDRPHTICPECSEAVILKLGQKISHHVAHRPNFFCVLTNPESVLHFNTKTYLRAKLSEVSELYVYQQCKGWNAPAIGSYKGGHRACSSKRRHLWLKSWDRVEVEKFIESRKPDIVFYKDDKPIAAIEVFATHGVDEQKRADLERLGIPWLEVKASEEFYDEAFGWQSDSPLPFVNCAPTLPEWICNHCIQESEAYPARIAKFLEKEEERQRAEWIKRLAEREADRARQEQERRTREALTSNLRRYANVVFTYHMNGIRQTHFFYITYNKANGVTEEVTLQYGPDFEVIAHVSRPNISIQIVNDAFDAFMSELRKNSIHVISATNWMPFENVASFIEKWESPYIWDSYEWRTQAG